MSYDVLIFLAEYSVFILSGILSATIAGLLAYLIWLFLVKGAAKFVVKHAMAYMKFEMACFTLPIVCGVIYRVWKVRAGWRMKLSTTPVMLCVLALTALWMVMVVVVLIHHYHEYCKKRLLCAVNEPVKDENILAIVDKWKNQLGIRQKTMLFYNEKVFSPCIMYNKGYQILLPKFPITEKEMNMALLHELTHLKHGDIPTKNIAFIVKALHFFNPASYLLQKEIVKWSEVSCDWSSCESGKEEFSRKEYFSSIVDMRERCGIVPYPNIMCSLIENGELLEFRIDVMGLRKTEKPGRHIGGMVWITILMAVVILFSFQSVSSGLTYLTEGNTYFKKENSQEEIEKVATDHIFDNAEVSYWDGDILDRTESVDFELGSGKIEIFEFSRQLGNTVTVSVMCDDVDYQMGWIGEDGYIKYENCSGLAIVDFEFEDEGEKQFFIKNTEEKSCHMEVFFITSNE